MQSHASVVCFVCDTNMRLACTTCSQLPLAPRHWLASTCCAATRRLTCASVREANAQRATAFARPLARVFAIQSSSELAREQLQLRVVHFCPKQTTSKSQVSLKHMNQIESTSDSKQNPIQKRKPFLEAEDSKKNNKK